MRSKAILGLTLVAGLGLAGCSDPYDPGQRALGGGAIGALGGAALGGILGGGQGAAIGALSGGVLGAGTGAVTAPSRPNYYQQPQYQQQQYQQPSQGYYQPRSSYGY